ncbi:hypothetical protein H7H51_23105 [Mycolicibacterium farcinogenes]|nr:hypothetical protein [Mycolicibacterium farcinogenes]
MGYPGLWVDTEKLGWNPAKLTVPDVPQVEGKGDPVSILAAAVMPGYRGQVEKQVADTHAREEQFAANLKGVQAAYGGTDGAGGTRSTARRTICRILPTRLAQVLLEAHPRPRREAIPALAS